MQSKPCVTFKNGCSPLLPIEVSPLNNLKRGNLCAQNSYPLDTLMIFGVHIYQVKICDMQELLPPLVAHLSSLS